MSTPGGSGYQPLVVVPDQVREVGRYVYGIADALQTALRAASREVDTLLGSGWTGDSADEFNTGWTETITGGTQICTALTGMAEKLGVTADNFQSQDTSAAFSLNMAGLDL